MKTPTLFIGTKSVIAVPMNREDYTAYRGWDLPEDENGSDSGYLVEYLDGGESNHSEHQGYISWSPEAIFDNSYKKSGEMSFGTAIEAAKRGYKVARSGWNGSNMFAYIVQADSYPAQNEAIKNCFVDDMVPYSAYWALKTAQGYVTTWAPSGSDSLANDWGIV